MPKLWNETIEEHRGAVRGAILDAVAGLVSDRGVAAVTMSQIAQDAGIGRATLYKYFPDVEAVLDAWHERHISSHLQQLARIKDSTAGDPWRKLEEVLGAYALIAHTGRGSDQAVRLHARPHLGHAEEHLTAFLADLLAEGVKEGVVRNDTAPEALAAYCLHALGAAAGMAPSAVGRLVEITMTGLRPEAQPPGT
ncbi:MULTISPECIES: TetR/AcrR family transcriptional regulator [unclassified Paenarthrobacter]|uniref:TetR/AcrR family transcriptional regulator n=1 Tax=unclassified Paenarthrobacter TaxID=2634190 RepID=UPI00141F5D92|nr:TetR/AcrR family transcriptional regulator [Paenarthrobacter sp. MSM-2-10-13]NHW49317.1 TetR/AcrR family transcriptional regulator [Paenarthrobacter sp. MSM-2-10-13]